MTSEREVAPRTFVQPPTLEASVEDVQVPAVDSAARQAAPPPPPADVSAGLKAPTPASILRAQRTLGNAFVQRRLASGASLPPRLLQREGPTAAPEGPVGVIENHTITTYADLARVYLYMARELRAEELALRASNAFVPPVVTDLQQEAAMNVGTWSGNKERVGDAYYRSAVNFRDAWSDAIDLAEDIQIRVASAAMKKAAEDAAKAEQQAKEELLTKLADAQAAAYAQEDDDLLEQVVGWVAKANDYATKLTEAQKQLHQSAAELANSVGKGVKCPPAVKYLHVFTAIGHAKTAYDGLNAVIAAGSTGATGYSEAVTGIKSFVALAEVGGTVLEAVTGMKLGSSPFFSDLLEVTLKALDQLLKVAKSIAIETLKRGEYDLVDWNHFPGGRAVFDFMLAVMRGGGPADVPKPVPGPVSDYLVGRDSNIEAGLEGSEDEKELPTSGILWWEDVDEAKIAGWVFRHRQNLWAMFYGSLNPAELP